MHHEQRYPQFPTGNFRISNSSLQVLFRCGLRFLYEREQDHRAATPAMVVGSAVSSAVEFDNRAKIADARRPSLSDIVDAGIASFDREVAEVEIDATRFELDRAKDSAAAASRCYGETLSPRIEGVLLAEESVAAEIAPGLEIVGRIDCVQAYTVRDTKTGRRWAKRRVDTSRQLSAYALLYESRFGKPPSRVAIDSLYETRGAWRAETIWSSRSERDLTAFVECAELAKATIEAGNFLPAPEGAWWCDEAWCPFWRNGRCTARPGA